EVDWMLGDTLLGTGRPPDFGLTAALSADGSVVVTAVARGAGGGELGRSDATLHVLPAPAGDCLAQLTAPGVTYKTGPANQGVKTPVTVTPPINGVSFTASGAAAPRTSWFMDCDLALSLWRFTDELEKRGIVAVTDDGIYNYRCIDQTVSPP